MTRVVILLLLLYAPPTFAVELGPQGVVRQYCRLDAVGGRASPRGWEQMAALTAWTLEPSWDELFIISDYTVGSPVRIAPGRLAVDVTYRVVGHVDGNNVDHNAYPETVRFEVGTPHDNGWLIFGPPQPPHVFATVADLPQLRRALAAANARSLTNSALIWNLYRNAGWSVTPQPLSRLNVSSALRAVNDPQPGDVVAFSWNGAPFHAGILDQDGAVISATLNLGTVRSSLDAFPGDRVFLRLVEPEDGSPMDLPTPRRVAPAKPPEPQPGRKKAAGR